MTATVCWRCERVRVRCYGVTCPACRVILHAAYEHARALNGGHLVNVPDDWDGPARCVPQKQPCVIRLAVDV